MSIKEKLAEARKKERLDCPYCAVQALFEFSTQEEQQSIEIRSACCPGCKEVAVQIRKVSHESAPKSPFGGVKFTKIMGNGK